MCGTCGCADGRGVTVHAEDGTHTHVLADGTVVTHAHHHEEGHEHHHAHPHTPGPDHSPGPGPGHDHSHTRDHAHAHDHRHTHGTVRHDPTAIDVEVQILAKNDRLAERNRGWFLGRDVVALNLMSSPGSGKTTLLEKTLTRMPERSAVLEGDQETDADAARIRATGARVVQINTGQGCHLEADMVWHGLQHLALEPASNLFIENVGNLVCPALFDLGESAKVVLFSVTEGEDKPLKYPHMFRTADLVILTKTDLLPYLDFDRQKALDAVRAVNPTADVLEVSSKTGDGMDAWLRWIEARRPSKTSQAPSATSGLTPGP